MTTRKYSSRSQQVTLTSAVTSGATIIPVTSATTILGGATVSAGQTFVLVIDPDTALEEIVEVTSVSANNLTVTRAVDMSGAAAQDHSSGAVVRHMIIGRDLREANLHIEATGGYNDGTGVHLLHGVSSTSAVVGTYETQSLYNKTLVSPILTGTQENDASIVFEGSTADAYETTLTVVDPTADRTITLPNTSGTVVLLDSTDTLTNKTLTSPTISGSPVITGLSSAGMSASSAAPKDYVDSILGSATSAATSAASAAASATAAATSASSAATSASLAATSASSASTSQIAAATSATSASASATAAATSATSAAASATAAATSATSAAAATSAVATSAASALTSQTAAATSASSAATSASSALTSQTAAATSATAAATSATSAAASATAAATSATSAAASATAAATSAASAAAAMTNAVDKTTFDAKGDLLAGTANDAYAALTVATTDGYLLSASSGAATGLAWTAAPSGYTAPTIGTTTITSGTTVSTITSVALSNASLTGTLTAGASSGTNGQLLTSTGTGVQWAAAPVSLPSQTSNTNKLLTTDGTTASWSGAAPVAQTTEPSTLIDGLIWVDTDGTAPTTVVTRWSKAPTNGTTSLSGTDDGTTVLAYTPGYEEVFLNGVLLSRANDYTATTGTSVVLTTATVTGDLVEIICPLQVAYTDAITTTAANAAYVPKTLTTTTGDIIYASAANTPARLGIGTSGQVLAVNGSGVPAWAAPGSTFAGCSVYKSAAQSTTSSTPTAVTYDTELYDTDGYHSTVSNTERFTVPAGKAGYYLFTGSIQWTTGLTGYRDIYLMLNASTVIAMAFAIVDNAGYPTPQNTVIVYLAVGDYVWMTGEQSSGGALTMRSGRGCTMMSLGYLGA